MPPQTSFGTPTSCRSRQTMEWDGNIPRSHLGTLEALNPRNPVCPKPTHRTFIDLPNCLLQILTLNGVPVHPTSPYGGVQFPTEDVAKLSTPLAFFEPALNATLSGVFTGVNADRGGGGVALGWGGGRVLRFCPPLARTRPARLPPHLPSARQHHHGQRRESQRVRPGSRGDRAVDVGRVGAVRLPDSPDAAPLFPGRPWAGPVWGA